MPKKEDREHRLWKLDPKIFETKKAGFLERHVLGLLRSIGGYSLLSLAFAYPIVLVYLGVAYGGLVFWGSFAGSVILMVALMRGLGFEKNFANKDISWKRTAAIPISFLMALAFILGLVYLRLWFIPIALAILSVTFTALIGLRRHSAKQG